MKLKQIIYLSKKTKNLVLPLLRRVDNADIIEHTAIVRGLDLRNLKDKTIKNINHNLDILEDGQGGLLEILYHNEIIFISYSENRGNGKSSTSVASANFDYKNLIFKNIF